VKEDRTTGLLKDIALFSSLSPEELHQIRGKVIVKHFKKNEMILREEDTNAFMYIIIDGAVKAVQTTEAGKEIMVTLHQTGDFFGELALIDGKTMPAAVRATRDSVVAIIAKKDFYSILFHQNKVVENLLTILCSRLRESMKKIQLLTFNNAAQRVKMLFLMLLEPYGEETPEGTVLKLRLTHQQIADMTGLTRETVTRVLDKWQKSRDITMLKNRFILLRSEFESIEF
jgi:CRP/FNR family cyclic AMP-dependent transcriptional regulator